MSPNIKHLILPLRTRDKLKHSPILIMHTEEHIDPEIWNIFIISLIYIICKEI